MIACIDPGTSVSGGTGVAYFDRFGTLLEAFLLRPPAVADTSERIRQTVRSIRAPADLDLCIVEWPQIYKGSRTNPNHLLGLVGMAMALATALGAQECRAVLPHAWKGTLDGDAMSKRIEGRLSAAELDRIAACPASLRHNILDAVGLGLWHFGRLEKRMALRR